MSEVTDFLLEQIAADEAVARAAISATGDDHWGTHTYRVVASGEFEVADASVPTADHIARHDPARVLAECAAKRAVVERHACDFIGSWRMCKTCADWDEADYDGPPRTDWPCPTLRAIAGIYAGADDWREEWA